MRAGFFALLLVLLASIVGFGLLQRGEGYVLVVVAGYTVEMSFVVACLLNALLFFVLCFCWVITRALLSSRRGVLGWAASRRRQRGLSRTTQGLVAFVEGRWDFARKLLSKSAVSTSTPLINYLFAARASSAIGDAKAVDAFLKKAELSTEGADVAIGLTQAELQIKNGQYEQALASLLRIKKQAGNHAVVLELLAGVHVKLADWSSLLKLLPALRHSDMAEATVQNFEQQACCEMLVKEALSGGEAALFMCWKQLPSVAKKRAVVVVCYAKQLMSLQQLVEAELILRTQLQREYDAELIKLYGCVLAENPAKQLAYAEKLLKTNASDADLLGALGQINGQLKDTVQAKAYFEKSLAAQPKPEVYAALAKIYAKENNFKKSTELYAQGAALQIE